jgi:Secretion system C-terminal sorting domain
MKILACILVSLMACPTLGFSQDVPLFQFSLYFQDSVGNRDSVILGYDPSASSQHLNEQFGETLISAPFDSVFEVRAIHGDDPQERTSKKTIAHMEVSSDSCILPYRTKIVINNKYPPVRITYDSTLFPIGTCVNAVLSPDRNMFFLPEWWDVCAYHCMAGASMYVEDFVIPPPVGLCWNHLYIEKEVAGQGLKQLPGLFFVTFYGPGPCNDTTFLAAKDPKYANFGTLSPNPVSAQFSVALPSEVVVQVAVTDITGRRVQCPYKVSAEAVQFDADALSPGLYFVLLQAESRRQAVYKFVKL